MKILDFIEFSLLLIQQISLTFFLCLIFQILLRQIGITSFLMQCNKITGKIFISEDSGETEYKDLLSELKILIHVGEHKNIVNLLGACTEGMSIKLSFTLLLSQCSFIKLFKICID